MELGIRALTPDLMEAYLDFFDRRAFSDGSPYFPCYCTAFNMSAAEIETMREQGKAYGGGTDGWQRAQRETAARMIREGRIRGYLAFADGLAVGWCNAGDRINYRRVGAFDLDQVPPDCPPDCERAGQVKSVVCFEICPEYRGKGIAARMLQRVCEDAGAEGFEFAEAYPTDGAQPALAFTGPAALYEKTGFTVFSRKGETIVMRKKLST